MHMLPFTVDKILMDMNHEMDDISKNIVKWKYKFCLDFERELQLEPSEFSQTVFDYIFNLYFFRKAFGKLDFKRYVEDLKDLNFLNTAKTCEYINKKYGEFIIVYKKYFMDYFGLSHEDPLYIERKFHDNRAEMRNKILEYY